MSTLESTFDLHLRAHKLDGLFVREHKFHPDRKWRFDFAAPALKVAVELEGGIFSRGKSSHRTGVGIRRDMEKSNEAQKLGWRVFRFYVDDVKSGAAVQYIKQIIEEEVAA
jgi:very-short-patch-repair endonuclease